MDIDGLHFDSQSGQIFFHFDVADHHLKLETFVHTAQRAQRIINALDQSFFQGKLKYELIVVPPESGTFLTKLSLYVWAGAASVLAFMNTDIGKAYIDGLTGHIPAHWAKQIGEDHRAIINAVSESVDQHIQDDDPSDDNACIVSAIVISEMTRGILERDSSVLVRLGMESGNLPDAIEARNEFYEACIADPEVNGIGFTPDDDFPVPRNAFPERAIKARRKEEEDDPLPWSVAIESIFVTSPNWDKDDQASRQWKGKDSIRRECFFVIDDEEFWFHVKNRELHVEVLDHLKVQWAFQSVEGRTRNRRVLRVLEFNGEKLADPLGSKAIKAILGQFSEAIVDKNQGSLFYRSQ